MPIFIIRHPEDQEERTLTSALIGILEKMHSLIVYDAICVICPEGDPEVQLLRSLAWHEIGEPEPIVQAPALAVIAPVQLENKPVATFEGKCRNCGKNFSITRASGPKQVYCSPSCRNQYNQRQYQERKTNGDGSGVVHGRLTLGKNR